MEIRGSTLYTGERDRPGRLKAWAWVFRHRRVVVLPPHFAARLFISAFSFNQCLVILGLSLKALCAFRLLVFVHHYVLEKRIDCQATWGLRLLPCNCLTFARYFGKSLFASVRPSTLY